MIHSLEINGYRGFSHFEMNGLGRINLLVGVNNSGKTSVLEALRLLASEGDPGVLQQITGRRGELISDNLQPGQMFQPEIDICHLFNGHVVKTGISFSVKSTNATLERSITYKIDEAKQERLALFPPDGDEPGDRLALFVEGIPAPAPTIALIPLTRREGVRFDTFNVLNRMPKGHRHNTLIHKFIGAESVSPNELLSLWAGVSLTPAEARTVRALQSLDPKIERIANIPTVIQMGPMGQVARGGFKVKLANVEKPIPIGSLGDGIWRILSLAITLSQVKDGLLLIDEIDSGLHYSVMADMWRLVTTTAKELNVQVFATTHSIDCVNSLASICQEDSSINEQVSIQRIESDHGRAVAYTGNEIKKAAERHIEVR